jgi:quinoprotein glucose dehydrogenase
LKVDGAKDVAIAALKDRSASVRAKGASALAALDPKAALPVLERIVREGEVAEKQSAFEALASLEAADVDGLLLGAVNDWRAGRLPPGAALEALAAARKRAGRGSKDLASALADYDASLVRVDVVDRHLASLEGGDAGRGEKLFKESSAACQRCHALGTEKSAEVGPPLGDVALRRDRRFLLTSILDPNRDVLDGYKHEILETKTGEVFDARILKDAGESLEVEIVRDGETKTRTVAKSDLAARKPGLSSMPQDVSKDLSPRQLRDLVEFLATRKGEGSPKSH